MQGGSINTGLGSPPVFKTVADEDLKRPDPPPRDTYNEQNFFQSNPSCAGQDVTRVTGKRFIACHAERSAVAKLDNGVVVGWSVGFIYWIINVEPDINTNTGQSIFSNEPIVTAGVTFKTTVGAMGDVSVGLPVRINGGISTQVTKQDNHFESIFASAGGLMRWIYYIKDNGVVNSGGQLSVYRPIFQLQASAPGFTRITSQEHVGAPIRCDSKSYTVRGPGCVIDPSAKNLPIMDLTTTRNLPSGAVEATQFWDHVLNSENNGSPGNAVDGRRLTRLRSDDPQLTANRDTACPKKVLKWKPDPTGSWQCDEYPFASTAQGAARKPNGGRTFNFCKFQTQADGTANAYLPLAYVGVNYDLFGWTACIIPTTQNQAGGKLVKPFYNDNRILTPEDDQDDGFYVQAYH